MVNAHGVPISSCRRERRPLPPWAEGIFVWGAAGPRRDGGAPPGPWRGAARFPPPQAIPEIPAEPFVDPVAVPPLRLVGRDEVLHLHLLELPHAEEEVAGSD